MHNTFEHDTEVLIVGAGPTGLTLAIILRRYGIRFRIIERKPALSRHTKATNLMQRTQELISSLGLLGPLNKIGGQMSRLMVHAYGKSFGPRTMHLNETPFSDVILCGQHNYEAVAAAELNRLGVEIEFKTALVELSQDADGCLVSMGHGNGTRQFRFAFVVGCDGHAGITRNFTKNDFTPKKTGVAIRQVDCRLSWHRLSTMQQMWLFYFNHGFAAVVPLPNNTHRVLTVEPKTAIPEREPTLAEMQEKLRVISDDPSLTLSDPQWFSYTDLSMGIAPALRDGRILFAGDVGNPVLPNGGQGMNTGIGDAFNLGWKLATVLRHDGSDGLLDTYNQERHALRFAMQKVQFNSLKYTTLVTPKLMQWLFRVLAEPILNRGGERLMAQAFSELKISTRKSPLTVDLCGKTGVRAGDRVPDAGVILGDQSTRLFDLIYHGGWTLLTFTGRDRHADLTGASDSRRLVEQSFVRSFIVTAKSTAETPNIVFDLDEEAHRVYGVTRPLHILIRPDGYVGIRVPFRKTHLINGYVKRWTVASDQSFRAPTIH